MKILLTGCTGFLGKIIYQKLSIDHSVFGLSRSDKSDYSCDLSTNIPDFETAFDLVIHSAGLAHIHEPSKSDIENIYNTNVVGTINLLHGLKKSKLPKRFVFISSVSVYGREFGYNINEDAPLLATDIYGKSKILAEKMIINWGKENKVLSTILRLPLLIGPNPPGNLGSMIRGIKKGYYFNISGIYTKKSMVMSEDVAEYIIESSNYGDIFNLTDGYHPSFHELSNSIALQTGKKNIQSISFFFVKILSKIGDFVGHNFPINSKKFKKIISPLTFDDTKAKLTFNWNPKSVINNIKIK